MLDIELLVELIVVEEDVDDDDVDEIDVLEDVLETDVELVEVEEDVLETDILVELMDDDVELMDDDVELVELLVEDVEEVEVVVPPVGRTFNPSTICVSTDAAPNCPACISINNAVTVIGFASEVKLTQNLPSDE